MEGFQIKRRKCKEEPCVGERLQERKCQPTTSDNCKGLLCSAPFYDYFAECEIGV